MTLKQINATEILYERILLYLVETPQAFPSVKLVQF